MKQFFKFISIFLAGALLIFTTSGCELLGGDDTPAYLKKSYLAVTNSSNGYKINEFYIGDDSINDWTSEILFNVFGIHSLGYDEFILLAFDEQLPTFDIHLEYSDDYDSNSGFEYLYNFDVPVGKILIVEFLTTGSNTLLDDASNWEQQINSVLGSSSSVRSSSGILKNLSGAGIGSK